MQSVRAPGGVSAAVWAWCMDPGQPVAVEAATVAPWQRIGVCYEFPASLSAPPRCWEWTQCGCVRGSFCQVSLGIRGQEDATPRTQALCKTLYRLFWSVPVGA